MNNNTAYDAYQDLVWESSDYSSDGSSEEDDMKELPSRRDMNIRKFSELDTSSKNIDSGGTLLGNDVEESAGNAGDANRRAMSQWNELADLVEDYSSDEEKDNDGTISSSKIVHERPKFRTNDELLYNPGADDMDEKYVEKLRQSYLNKKSNGESTKEEKNAELSLPRTDAVLNCPLCFATLSYDCQRHELYKNQYRAIFVQNVKTIDNERLVYKNNVATPIPSDDNIGAKSKPKDVYYRVVCSECGADVAVVDGEEVYHFFNVFASS